MTSYYARGGKVYDAGGIEAGTARTTSGRDLEAHEAALDVARRQREQGDHAGPWRTVAQLKQATRAAKARAPERGDFFGPQETRFFGARYSTAVHGGRYFVHSVKPPYGPRVHHVTRAGDADPATGAVNFDTIGRWGSDGYTPAVANRLAALLADAETVGLLRERNDRSHTYRACVGPNRRGCSHDSPGWALFELKDPSSGIPLDLCSECVGEHFRSQ